MLAIAIIALLSPFAVNAQDSSDMPNFDASLSISPAIYETKFEQGKVTNYIFELTNKLDKTVAIKSYIRLFGASDELGGMDIFDKSDSDRLSPQNWVKIIEPNFVLKPNGSRQIKVQFSPPADLPPGGHYAILFFEPQVKEQEKPSSVINVGGRIGALLFLTAAGDIKESGAVASFHTAAWQIWRTPLQFVVRFQNSGNVHLRPQGKIMVTNLVTRSKREVEVPQFTVLPQKTRRQEVENSIGKYPAIYRAKLDLNYGQESPQNATANIVFVYFSWPYLLGTVLIVGAAGYFGLSARRRRKFLAAMRALFGRK